MKRNRHYYHEDGILWSFLRLLLLIAFAGGALAIAAHIANGL